jgi:hypothetical protein
MGAQAKKTQLQQDPTQIWMGAPKSSLRHLFLGSGLGTQKAVSAVFLQARHDGPSPLSGSTRAVIDAVAQGPHGQPRHDGVDPDGVDPDFPTAPPFLRQGSHGSYLPPVPVDAWDPP